MSAPLANFPAANVAGLMRRAMVRFVNVAAKIDRGLGTTEEVPVLVNVESIDCVVGFAPNKSRIKLRGGSGLVVSMSIERLRDLLAPPPSKAIDEE